MNDEFARRLLARAAAIGLAIAPREETRLTTYFELLRVWNRKVNLTGLPLDPLSDHAIDRLFLEPMAAARFFQNDPELRGVAQNDTMPQPIVASSGEDTDGRWLDLGSGGGSPAIPMKIAFPECRPLFMVESRTKKVAFLREAVRALELRDVDVVHARFEELTSYAGTATLITVRAVLLDVEFGRAVSELLRRCGILVGFESSSEMTALADLKAVGSHQLFPDQSSWIHIYRH